MYQFCEDVIAMFGKYYMREPNTDDTAHLLSINEIRCLPGCLAALTASIGSGKNCPFGWQGQFKGHKDGCTVILKVVCCLTGSLDLALLLCHGRNKQ
jgi:hypothetical protein